MKQSTGLFRFTLRPVRVRVPPSDLLHKHEKEAFKASLRALAEDMGLEPTGLLRLTRFPGELLSHSVNPPRV